MLDFSKLRQITLADKPFIDTLTKQYPSQSCEMCFANLMMWSSAYKTQILELTPQSLLAYNPTNQIIHFPLGIAPSPSELFEIARDFVRAKKTQDAFIYDVPPEYVNANKESLEQYFFVTEHVDEFDYIYDLEHLIALDGKKLRKKRNLIKQFEETYPDFCCEKITPQNINSALLFVEKINSQKEKIPLFNGLYNEDEAMIFGFKHFEELGLEGVILYASKSLIAGVAIFSPLNDSIWTIHFEKSDVSIKGAPQMLVLCEAKALKESGASLMNREQDLGLENLRKAKESLDPCAFYKRHFLKLKNLESI